MRSDARTILFVREVPWETVFPISTRMLAAEFARDGWNVIWLTPPLMPWHHEGNKAHFQQLQAQHARGGIVYDGNVFAYTPRGFVPFSARFPLDRPVLAHWMWHGCWPTVRGALRRANVPDPDVLFISSWAAGEVRRLFPGRPVVFHVTDNYQYFPSVPPTARHLERENYASADHIFVTTPSLKTALQTDFRVAEDKISVVIHGVDLDRFASLPSSPLEALATLPRPRLVALGNPQWLHYPLLAALAEAFPQGSLVILGPRSAEIEALAAVHPNIFPLGPIGQADVPTYLASCDVGLILYGDQIAQRAQEVCPMKLFEYAAAGLPVASTPLSVYDDLNVPVWQVDTVESAVQGIAEALAQTNTLGATMRAFAAQNSWRRRYQEVLGVMEPLLTE